MVDSWRLNDFFDFLAGRVCFYSRFAYLFSMLASLIELHAINLDLSFSWLNNIVVESVII